MANTLKFGNGEWYGKKDTILAYNDENYNYKPLPFDFSRASSATVINKDGLIETVGSGQPRIDYKDDSKGALLLEPSRSNLIQYSDFNSVWTNTSKLTLNTVISPQGIQNGNTLSKGSAYDASSYIISSGVSSGQTAIFSVFVKKNTTNILGIRLASGSSASDIRKNINLDTGEITNGAAGNQIGFISLEKEDFGNGWYRLKLKGTTSGNDNVCSLYAGSIGNTTNDGEVYIFGAQLEQGSYATSYIPTQGSAVTRLADSSTNCGAGTNIFSNTSAVWFIDFSRFVYDSSIRTKAMTLENSSGVEQIRFHFDQPAKTVRFRDALNSFSTIGGYISTLDNTRKKVALKIDGTTLSVFSDGVKIGSDYTRPTGFDIDTMDLYWGGSNIFDIKFYNTALTDAELISLTS